MEENKKIDKQIVIMVILVIILILSLLGILVYEVYENKKLKNNNVNNTSSTTTSSTTISSVTTTTKVLDDKELVASNVITEYLENLKKENKIGKYTIINSKVLNEEDLCPDMIYDDNKIYYNVEIEFEKLDKDFTLTGNDTNTENEKIYIGLVTYIISNNKLEDLYTEC